MAYVRQQSFTRAPATKPSLIKMQYGQNDCQPSEEVTINEGIPRGTEVQAHWLEPEPSIRHVGNGALAASPSRACVRSLTRTWTAVTIPTVFVDLDSDVTQDDSPSPVETHARALRRLQEQARLAPASPGSQDQVTDGAGDPVAAADSSRSGPATGWLPHDDSSPPQQQQQQPNSSASSPKGITRPRLPAVSSRDDGSGTAAATAVGRLTSPRYRTSAAATTGGGGDARDGRGAADNDGSPNGDVDAPVDGSSMALQAPDFLVRPPGLDSALSALRPQPPARAPRLQRRYYKSLEQLSDIGLARFTVDNVVATDIAGEPPPGFASTGGNPAGSGGGGDAEADGDSELTGEWLLHLGRSVPPSPRAGSGAALKPTPRAPSMPTAAFAGAAVAAAPMLPRSMWPASPLTSTSASGQQPGNLQQQQPQQQQQQQRQPEPSGSAFAAAMRSASPPLDAARQLRKSISSSFSAGKLSVPPPPLAGIPSYPPQQPPSQLPSPLQLSSPSTSALTAPVSALMSYMLTNAERPPWRLSRGESSLQQRFDNASIDFVRSISRKPSNQGNRGPPLQLTSFGRNSGVATAGGSASGGSFSGGGGATASSPQGQGPERSWQSFTAGTALESPVSSSYGDLTEAVLQQDGGGGTGAVGPSPRRHTMHAAATSPTGHQGRPGSSLFPPPAATTTGGSSSQSNVRFRQNLHHQQNSPHNHHHNYQPGSPAGQDHHLFRPLCCDDLPGSPTPRSPSVSVTAATSAYPSPSAGQQQLSQQLQQALVPSLSANQQRRTALLRKLSDGDLALPAAAGGGGSGGAAAAATASGGGGGGGGSRAQQNRAGFSGVGGGRSGERPGEGGGAGAARGGGVAGVHTRELDGADGLMARLFQTLNDLRRQESAARDLEDA